MKVLIVSKSLTHPVTAGNRRFIYSQAELFKKMNYEVHFLYVEEIPVSPRWREHYEGTAAIKQYWKDKLHIFRVNWLDKIRMTVLSKIIRPIFNNSRMKVDDMMPILLTQYVNKLNAKYKFDCCIVNYYFLSKIFVNCDIPLKGMTTHDYFAYKDILVGEKGVLNATDAHQEAMAMQRCPHIFALNTEEAIYYSKLSPLSSIYNVFSTYQCHESPIVGNKNIVFLSGSNQYNVNGLKWFIQAIFPAIIDSHPDVKLIIGGSICRVIRELSDNPNIELVGLIDDVEGFYNSGDVAMNPTYQGTGLKIKTFEALSYDKITMVHPHSMIGIYRPDTAPIFASTVAQEWVNFLDKIWTDRKLLIEIKKRNRDYLRAMEHFVENEYRRFFSNLKVT